MKFAYKDKDGEIRVVEVTQVFESEDKLMDYLHAQSPAIFHIQDVD